MTSTTLYAKPVAYNLISWFHQQFRQVILFILPFCLTLINPNWIYNPTVLNSVDTWIYTGLFRNFFELADTYPSNGYYFVERLTAILPGYAAYQLFPPELANGVLHLAVYLVAVFALYGIVKRLFNEDIAFVTAMCLGCYTWFLRAVGHDYVDGIGITYYLIALWFATEAVYRTKYKRYLFGCGVFISATFISQIFWLSLIPAGGVYYLALNWKNNKHSFLASFIYTVGGGIFLVGILMLFNLLTLGTWDIFTESLVFIQRVPSFTSLASTVTVFYGPIPRTWLVLPCVLSIISIIYLLRWSVVPVQNRFVLRLVIIVFTVNFGIFVIQNYLSPFMYMTIYLYMSLLIPVLFLLLAGLIAQKISPITPNRSIVSLIGVLIPFILIILHPSISDGLKHPIIVWAIAGCALFIVSVCLVYNLNSPLFLISFSVMSVMFSGHNGTLYYDRLYNYRVFNQVFDTLTIMESKLSEPWDDSQFLVLFDLKQLSPISVALRSMSQPILSKSLRLDFLPENLDALRWFQPIQQPVFLITDSETTLDEFEAEVGELFNIEVIHRFEINEIVSSNTYTGYIFMMTRQDRYNWTVLATGENINRPTEVIPPRVVAWTGPDSEVVLQANLPAATSDIVIKLCGIVSTTELATEMPATVNQTPVVFTLMSAEGECFIRYVAEVPQAVFTGEGFTEIAFNVPVALPDKSIVGPIVKEEYGIALTTVTFFQRETP